MEKSHTYQLLTVKFFACMLVLWLANVTCAQQIDIKTQNKVKVKYFAAEEYFNNSQYDLALGKIEEAEALLAGTHLPTLMSLKINTLAKLNRYAEAQQALDILYDMNPPVEILKEIALIEPEIEQGLIGERAKVMAEAVLREKEIREKPFREKFDREFSVLKSLLEKFSFDVDDSNEVKYIYYPPYGSALGQQRKKQIFTRLLISQRVSASFSNCSILYDRGITNRVVDTESSGASSYSNSGSFNFGNASYEGMPKSVRVERNLNEYLKDSSNSEQSWQPNYHYGNGGRLRYRINSVTDGYMLFGTHADANNARRSLEAMASLCVESPK